MSHIPVFDDHIAPLETVIAAAKALGATDVDAVIADGQSLSVGTRLTKLEKCEQSDGQTLGLRVFVGKQSATIATNDLRVFDPKSFAERAVTMAKCAPEDPFSGLAEAERLARGVPQLDNADAAFSMDAAELQAWCEAAENTALSSAGITNTEGAEASAGRSRFTLMTSTGFAASRASTHYGLSVTAIASEDDGRMVQDYDFTSSIYKSDLRAAADVGAKAAEYALRMRKAQKIETMNDLTVVYDARAARSLLGHFLGAINGASIALGRSFLNGKLGEEIFAPHISIIDEPHIQRGLRSRAFDAEGLATQATPLIEDGKLMNYLLDLRSARKLNMAPTGHASRGASSQPGPSASNVALAAGTQSVAELIKDIKRGLFVTDVFGQGVNGITGDYSRGAAGLLIENGQLTVPVHEVTVASTLQHMFRHLVPANDLVRLTGVDCPTLRIDGMTLAGK